MLTIGEYADVIMVGAFRAMRACAVIPNGSKGTLSFRQAEILREMIDIGTCDLANSVPGFNRAIVPYLADVAYAVAMTETCPMGSDRYYAWREYELELMRRALAANR